MDAYQQIRTAKGLARVGEFVRSKKYTTIWKVIEEKEVWQNVDDDPVTKEARMVPAIYLRFWRWLPGQTEGTGKTMAFHYTQYDTTFSLHWEKIPLSEVPR